MSRRDPYWYEKPRTEWTTHDWLYAAAAAILKQDDEDRAYVRCAQIVMDFADDETPPSRS